MDEKERLRRWRLVLGGDSEETIGCGLAGEDRGMDGVLAALYGGEKDGKNVGHGGSLPNVTRWLGDIRTYFPSPVVRVMQKDALDRLGLERMLLEPEMLDAVEPDVHLVATLMSLGRVIPEKTKESARLVVRKVVEELERRLAQETEQAVRGALNRAARTSRPRPADIDWDRTIRANLKNYLPVSGTVIPEKLVGHARKKRTAKLRDIVLCVDQSGSMATSVVYSGIFGAVLASIRAVSTRMVVYDTSVADLTEDLQDPVDLLFGAQLGGGNDTPRALAYCQGIITRPNETVMVLVTDCYEGALSGAMLERTAQIVDSGVTMICLLALSDDGAPSYDRKQAAAMASLGVPTFACTPDKFPGMMAAAIQKQDLDLWAARNDIVTARSD
ncbi:MAG: VWA domain-containing protein [Rubrobacter sp.]|nr:VWA domain-containing protein [Rubrobacter sp.]